MTLISCRTKNACELVAPYKGADSESAKLHNVCCVVLPWTGNDIKLPEAIHAHYVWRVTPHHSRCRWWCAASVNRSRQRNSTWRYDKANVLSVMTWRHCRVTYINWTILLITTIPYPKQQSVYSAMMFSVIGNYYIWWFSDWDLSESEHSEWP